MEANGAEDLPKHPPSAATQFGAAQSFGEFPIGSPLLCGGVQLILHQRAQWGPKTHPKASALLGDRHWRAQPEVDLRLHRDDG